MPSNRDVVNAFKRPGSEVNLESEHPVALWNLKILEVKAGVPPCRVRNLRGQEAERGHNQ